MLPLVFAIVGGALESEHLAVVDLELGGAQCSGVLVAPRVVATAAHCVGLGAGTVVDTGAVIDRTWIDRNYSRAARTTRARPA